MLISEFDYDLPEELIAQRPAPERDASRMLVVERASGLWRDSFFRELPAELSERDVLVLNNTRVFPARLAGRREPSGGRVEIFLIEEREPFVWDALARPARRLQPGQTVSFGGGRLRAEVVAASEGGRRTLRFSCDADFHALLEEFGQVPLPPYIKRGPSKAAADDDERPREEVSYGREEVSHEGRREGDEGQRDEHGGERWRDEDGDERLRKEDCGEWPGDEDRERYQTVYARARGAIAAPTAGLHFTPRVLAELRGRGVSVVEITLHVGYGTFAPVRVEDLSRHAVEPERYEIAGEAAELLNEARAAGRRLVAVGTTTVRALESATDERGRVRPGVGVASLTITPGYRFKSVGALVTNFHLPRSSLLVLVAALAGRELVLAAYRHAVAARYRFYSYGDCMLIK